MADIEYIYGVITLVMSVVTIVCNVMIIVAFIREQNLQSRPRNMLILAIAVSDLIYGIHLFVYYGVTLAAYPYGEYGCMISVITEYTYNISNTILVTISLDRLLLLMLPYPRYLAWQSRKGIKVQIAICYGLGITTAIVELSLWNYAKRVNDVAASIDFDLYCLFPPSRMTSYGLVVSLGYYCIPVVLVALLSVVFFAFLKVRIKKTNQLSCSTVNVAHHSREQSVATPQGDEEDNGGNQMSVRRRYLKPAITLASLVTAMSLSSLPFCSYTIIVVARPDLNNFEVIYIMLLIAQLNPLLDPIFYGATQRSIQDYYKKVFVKLFKRY